jgi:hypothetical protein
VSPSRDRRPPSLPEQGRCEMDGVQRARECSKSRPGRLRRIIREFSRAPIPVDWADGRHDSMADSPRRPVGGEVLPVLGLAPVRALDRAAMTPPSHARAKELFLAAIERPPAEREAFLARACGSDSPLRSEVESLLVNCFCSLARRRRTRRPGCGGSACPS